MTKVMLASNWHPKNETMFPFWVQPKLDGIRCRIGEDGYAYSRSQKPIRNEEFQALVRRHREELAGLDGELIVGDPTAANCYTRTMSTVMSFEHEDWDKIRFYVFDYITELLNYDYRLDVILSRELPSFCEILQPALIRNMQMLEEYEEMKLSEGHEGVILRRPDARYKFGRGTPTKGELIKRKKFEDMEGVIIEVHEEMQNTNEAKINANGHTERSGHKANLIGKNRLGAVTLGISWKGERTEVRVGSGFDAAQRESLWRDREHIIGQTVKFRYFDVGCKDRPRFPTFLGFRDPYDMDQRLL